jgi:hypothetical protein
VRSACTAFLLLLLAFPAWAQLRAGGEGTGTRNAELETARAVTNDYVIRHTLRKDALSYLRGLSRRSSEVRRTFGRMLEYRVLLVKVIREVPLEVSPGCSENPLVIASTYQTDGTREGILEHLAKPICFDSDKLGSVLTGELLGVFFHELAHKFGYDDNAAYDVSGLVNSRLASSWGGKDPDLPLWALPPSTTLAVTRSLEELSLVEKREDAVLSDTHAYFQGGRQVGVNRLQYSQPMCMLSNWTTGRKIQVGDLLQVQEVHPAPNGAVFWLEDGGIMACKTLREGDSMTVGDFKRIVGRAVIIRY